MGNRVRSSWPIPSRIARANASSLQVPAPVSWSGVRFGAIILPGRSVYGSCWPPPFIPAGIGSSRLLKSWGEWQYKQPIESAMYLPRSIRAGVLVNVCLVRSRLRGPMKVRKPKTCTAAAATTTIKTPRTRSAIFTPFRTVAVASGWDWEGKI